MIRLIACDIDGTLHHGDETQISPRVFEEIDRLAAKGIPFCPASGRQYSSLRRLFQPVADRLYYVCENGAVVFGPGNPGPLLAKTAMDRTLAEELCRDILAVDQCEVLVSGVNTSYLCPKHPDVVDHVRCFVGNRVALPRRPEDIPEDMVKVSAYCRRAATEVEPLLAPKWRAHFQAAVAGEKWLDFTLADKGTGIRALCAAMGIAPEEVMAIGDNYNDLPMLEVVGTPYIMENAVEDLRRRFPRRCTRVEDLLATL